MCSWKLNVTVFHSFCFHLWLVPGVTVCTGCWEAASWCSASGCRGDLVSLFSNPVELEKVTVHAWKERYHRFDNLEMSQRILHRKRKQSLLWITSTEQAMAWLFFLQSLPMTLVRGMENVTWAQIWNTDWCGYVENAHGLDGSEQKFNMLKDECGGLVQQLHLVPSVHLIQWSCYCTYWMGWCWDFKFNALLGLGEDIKENISTSPWYLNTTLCFLTFITYLPEHQSVVSMADVYAIYPLTLNLGFY